MINFFLTTNLTNKQQKVVAGKYLLFSFFFLLASFISAQTGTSLEAEIQNIERSIARQGVSAQERHAGLIRLATLRQLSGDIEGAARNWLDAARAIPGTIDDNALLNCAYCLAAMGEWDRARTALEPLLAKSARARFLNTSIVAVSANQTNALAAMADNPEYASMKSEIYFLLWRISNASGSAGNNQAERWRQRLIREFPQSPEARLASGGSLDAGQTIVLRQSPFWLFMGGLDALPLLSSVQEGRPSQTSGNQVTENRELVPTTNLPAASYVRLQTGIFSRESNAQAQAQRLTQAGFTPTIEERNIGGTPMWAVTVPEGQNQARTLEALRGAGFEAFPLR